MRNAYLNLLLSLVFLLNLSKNVAPTKDECCVDEPPFKKLKTNCYFESPKTLPRGIPRREEFKVSDSCDGDIFDLEDLANNHDGQLFGAPHQLGLCVARAEGRYLNHLSDLSEWIGKGICQKHLNELSSNFFGNRLADKRRDGKVCSKCAYPQVHSAKGTRSMSYEMSKNLLETKNIFVPVGAPLCDRHYKEIPKNPHESTGILQENNDFGESYGIAPADDYYENTDTVTQESFPADGALNFDLDCPMDSPDNSDHDDSHDQDYCLPSGKKEYTEVESAVFSLFKAAKIERGRCNKPFSEYTDRVKKAKANIVLEILRIIIGVMTTTDEDYDLVMEMVTLLLSGKSPKEENLILHTLLSTTAENFRRLRKYNEKVELLSFFAHSIYYRTMSDYIPNLSERMWNEAKKRAMSPVRKQPDLRRRERFDPVKLDFFISFITSPHIMVGIPYGEQKIKDTFGNTVNLPNTIRLTGTWETIELYEKWMRQTGNEKFMYSNSSTYKMLSKLKAMQSTSMTCVDYFQADATMGFIKIQDILKELKEMNKIDTHEFTILKRIFDESQVYLRTDFKFHVKEESRISDHCINHALSDPDDPRFASPSYTPHEHDQRCPMCEQMDHAFNDLTTRIDKMVEEASDQDMLKLLNIQNDFKNAIEKILDHKAHIVRTVFANNERDRLIHGLQVGEAFVTFDFAQKWLPSYFRERQKDFFGKPGYSWHISHVYANVSNELVQHVYFHIFKNDIQNGSVVVEVLKHVAQDLNSMGIKKMHLRSDNAAYYHSAPVMASIPVIAKDTGMEILSYSFSEAQSGKSSPDRYASYGKTKMRSYISAQHDIDTHEQMFVALTQGKLLRGVSVHLATVEFTPQPKTQIKGISGLSHFEFDGDTICAWKFRGIGEGMKVSGLKGITSSITFHRNGGKLSRPGLKDEDNEKIAKGEEPYFWFFPSKKATTIEEPGDVDDEALTGPVFGPPGPPNPDSSSPLFVCNQCSASFIRYHYFLRHLENGRHKIRPEKLSQYDFALGLYKRILEEIQQGIDITPLAESFKEFQQASRNPKPMGWAIRTTKKGARYNPKAKQLVSDMFEEYFSQGKPLRAEEAEMRMRLTNGILPSERMSHDQIKNYIRTLLAEKKKQNKCRRKRAIITDMELELGIEETWTEVEVDVHEDDRVFTAQDLYDFFLESKTLEELFEDPSNPLISDINLANFDE